MKSNLFPSALLILIASVWVGSGVAVFAAPSYSAAVLADGPIAYYRFSDTDTTALNAGSLGAAANGTYMGGAAPGAEAPRPPTYIGFEADNTAVQLDGAAGFVTTVTGLLNSRPKFTISGWIRRATDQPDRTGLFGQNDLVEFGFINNGTLECWTDNGLDIPNSLPNAEWDYVAVVSDGSPGTLTMYTNGLPAGSRTSTLPADNSFAFNIGGGGVFDVTGNFFNGQIDEVAVFDKPLSADQIAAHYLNGVALAPLILVQPQSANVFEGADVILTVKAFGTGPLHYQWFDFNTLITDATNASLVFSNITEAQGSSFVVEISNDFGDVTSDVVDVIVSPTVPPTITQDPASQSRYIGRSLTLTVLATGGSHLTYQWQKSQSNLPNETNSTLVFASLQSSDIGSYRVIVGNAAGTATSQEAVIGVVVPAPGSYEDLVVGLQPFAYWRFSETSGTIAHDFAGGFDGTYSGGVTMGAPGAIVGDADPAVAFDGASGAVTNGATLMNGHPKFTISSWINRAADQANRTGLFGQNDIVEFGYIDNNTLQAWTDNGLNVTPNPFPNGTWAHVALVSDGSPGTISIYTNGQFAASRAHTIPADNSFGFNIGGGGVFDGSGNFFNGSMDEVALFTRALSAGEIGCLYLSGTGQPLQLGIGPGNIVLDSKPSGTLHPAADVGATWIASSADVVATTRTGVMQFAAAESDQIVLPANVDFNTSQGTISLWMRSAGTTGAGSFGAILWDRRPADPTGPPGDVLVQQDDGHLFVQAASGAGGANSFTGTGVINDDLWHHIAYVFDQSAGGSITLYVDGVLDSSQANTAAWSWTATQPFELGRSHDPFWHPFDGSMDDFRFYNRMLTAGEIAQIAASDDLVDTAALKVRLNFDTPPTGVTLQWSCGNLEAATSLFPSNWAPVPGAVSPYVVNQSLLPAQFFRLHR